MTDVVLGRRTLEGDVLPARSNRRSVAVITDPGAAEYAGPLAQRLEAIGLDVAVVDVPAGEAAKTLAIAESVYQALNRLGLTRDDTVVAVGGGAVTDLAGFVAATYLRGVEAVYCPTTVLGAVDAAIGGKTGLNVDGKNLVGVFAHPSRVLIDINVLEALPGHLLAQGLAEALKAGLVGDPTLVELLERDGAAADLEEVVARAVDVKVAIVTEDFREKGRRAVLNYGHTVGHAVEVAVGLSHGEAVAIGMVAAGRVSAERAGFREEERVTSIISSLGLPTSLDTAPDLGRMRELMNLDKKRDAGGARMVLLEAIGRPIVESVGEEDVEMALQVVSPA